jgi:large subunit ribosomal protein L24
VLDEQRVVVQGVNLVKKHVKPNPMKGEPGGIVAREAPIQVSNIAIFNPATSKADRVGVRVLEDGSRVRFYKSTGETIAG